MDAIDTIRTAMRQMETVAQNINEGMHTIASGLASLESMMRDQAAVIDRLQAELATKGTVSAAQLEALETSTETIQATLSNALSRQQAIEGMIATEIAKGEEAETPPKP